MNSTSRSVKWGRPSHNKCGNIIRVSKCGRFRIETRVMASGVAYEPQNADGTCAAPLQDTLEDAFNSIEWLVNPWEPS